MLIGLLTSYWILTNQTGLNRAETLVSQSSNADCALGWRPTYHALIDPLFPMPITFGNRMTTPFVPSCYNVFPLRTPITHRGARMPIPFYVSSESQPT